MTAKSSIYSAGGTASMDAFGKSGVYARKDSCLTTGDLRGAAAAGRRETCAEDPGEVTRRCNTRKHAYAKDMAGW